MKATNFPERVRLLADRLGSARKLADLSGLSARSIAAYTAEETDPKRGDVVKMARAAGVSVGWLADGEGDIDAPASSHTAEQPRAGYVYIPLYDVRAAAGAGALVEHEQVTDLLAFKEEWLRSELNASPKDVVLLFVQGRSMEPDLRAGDVIMIDLRDTTAQREAIYVLRLEGAIVVKEVQRLPGGRVKVLSKNAGYDSWEFNVSELNGAASGGRDIAVIGRVVWACRRF